jgi:hypothetical protein
MFLIAIFLFSNAVKKKPIIKKYYQFFLLTKTTSI